MKIFRNRTVIGVLCILLALIICFGVTPLFSRSSSEKTEIVRVTKDIKEGDEITAEMVQTVEVGAYNLPQNLMTDKKEVVGKYATADLAAGDYILSSKLSAVPAAENAYLYNLDGKKQAISVTIKSFATGLSGKLESGDIVTVIVADYQGKGETAIPPELQYVEVISVTASSGYDANTGEVVDEKELPSTVTLLVTTEQAKVKIMFLALFFATIQYMFMLGTRTQFAILLLIVILAALQFAYSEQGIAGVLKCIGIMAVISLIAFLLYHFNVLSIGDYILSTNLAARYQRRASLENADSFRFQSFWIGLRELIQYPMGGRASQVYRHNMWLDVGRVSGIIPFCLLLVYSIKNFANVTVIWKNTKILPSLRYLLLFLYIGAYVNCFVEPIWEGALNFFLALCVVDGMVSAMMRRLENDHTPEESVSDTSNLHTDL